MKIRLLIFICCVCSLQAREFLYPVGYHPQRDTIFVVYQKTATHIELWEWNPLTHYADQLLLSRYSPAGCTFLPDYSGFSFIDNGQLKVKQLLKRSPRAIEYDAPLYNVEQIYWIDNKTCYTFGKYQDYFGIFQIDWDGVVQPLLVQEGTDFQYPQKIGSQLFVIERTDDGLYRIACTSYDAHYEADTFQERMISYQKAKPTMQGMVPFDKNPLAFLQMISDDEGFVLSHAQQVSKHDAEVHFQYYRLKYTEQWDMSLLFSFNIPTELLVMGPDRLYESILPLLPNVCQHGVYYVDSAETFLSLYYFDFSTQTKTIVAQAEDQHLFGFTKLPGAAFYGGTIGGCVGMIEGVQIRLGKLLC